MNLQENIQRIKEVMGLLTEVLDVDDSSYITMNIKQFPKYKKEISDLLKNKLESSQGNFQTFKTLLL